MIQDVVATRVYWAERKTEFLEELGVYVPELLPTTPA